MRKTTIKLLINLVLLLSCQILIAQNELTNQQKLAKEIVCENGILKFKDKKQMRNYAKQLAALPNEVRDSMEAKWKFNSIHKAVTIATDKQINYFDQIETNPNAKINPDYVSTELLNLTEKKILKKVKVPNEEAYFYEIQLIESPLATVLNMNGVVIIGNKAYQYGDKFIRITDISNINSFFSKGSDLTKIKVIDFTGSTRASGVSSSFIGPTAFSNHTNDIFINYKNSTNKFIMSRCTYTVNVDGYNVDGNVISQDATFYTELFALRRINNIYYFKNSFRGQFDMWGTSWEMGYAVGGINNDNTTFNINMTDGLTKPYQISAYGWWYREAGATLQSFDNNTTSISSNNLVEAYGIRSDNNAYGFDTDGKHNYAGLYFFPSGNISIDGINTNNPNAKSVYFTSLIIPRNFNLGGQFMELNNIGGNGQAIHLSNISNFNF